jgi:hypothetical protein
MQNPLSPCERAKQFASSVMLIIRETLSRVPENLMPVYLDALYGCVEIELWSERMELESASWTPLDDGGEDLSGEGMRPW